MEKEEEKCCGNCCWFCYEDTDGFGNCIKGKEKDAYGFVRCDDDACDEHASTEMMRHYMAVLIQANRYRRDQNVPSIYRMPNPKDLGKAIDFAIEHMKVFGNL